MILVTEKEFKDSKELASPTDINSLPKDVVIEFDDMQVLINSIKQTRGLPDTIGVSDVRLRIIDHAGGSIPVIMHDNRLFTLPNDSESTVFIGAEITNSSPRLLSGKFGFIIRGNTDFVNWGLPRKPEVYKKGSPIPKAGTWVQTNEEGLEEILTALKVYGRTNKGGISIRYHPFDKSYELVLEDDSPIYFDSTTNLHPIEVKTVFSTKPKGSFCLQGQTIALRISPTLQIDNYFASLSPLEATDNKERVAELKKLFYEGKTVGLITGTDLSTFIMSFGANINRLFKPKVINGKTVWPITLFSTNRQEHSVPPITRCDYLTGFNAVNNISVKSNSGPQRISNGMSNPISAYSSYSLSLVDTSDPNNHVTNDLGNISYYLIKMNFNPFLE